MQFGDVLVVAFPWDTIPQVLSEAGPLTGNIVIDACNQFGSHALPPKGQTAAEFNAGRMAGARYTKAFNTLTSRFQRETADRRADRKVVQ